eukprot:TRINITY_DN2341_c0_g1_i1.p1 TRINITY_DN2341_c0_g1~~TRINITY_DN2341_c0_g1_i1.p1  ORF type:complete len:377 (-),score=98.86 TRINITY_DN2341_c0_g1_i1:154-1284(-)
MEERADSMPLYEETKSSPISHRHLDTEILKIESELQEINKMHKPVRTPLRSKESQKAPVFHVSLYSPDAKSKEGIVCETSPRNYMHQSPLERYRRFERAKRNSMYKSIDQKINAEQTLSRTKNKPRQTDPLLLLDIILAQNVVIRLPVTKMDTPSYLAEECFALANMKVPKGVIDKLSKTIELRIAEEVQTLIAATKERQHQYIKEQMHQEHHAKQVAKESIKEFNLWTNRRPAERESRKVLGKLSVVIGKNRTGEIVVREGDDPLVLVENFITAFSLGREYKQYFLDTIEKLVSNMSGGEKEISLPKISEEVLFRVQFNMEEGRKVYLDIRKNDNLYKVAQEFVTDNGLDMEKVNTVWEYLQNLYRNHLKNNVHN